jgi:hypothetical protein
MYRGLFLNNPFLIDLMLAIKAEDFYKAKRVVCIVLLLSVLRLETK